MLKIGDRVIYNDFEEAIILRPPYVGGKSEEFLNTKLDTFDRYYIEFINKKNSDGGKLKTWVFKGSVTFDIVYHREERLKKMLDV